MLNITSQNNKRILSTLKTLGQASRLGLNIKIIFYKRKLQRRKENAWECYNNERTGYLACEEHGPRLRYVSFTKYVHVIIAWLSNSSLRLSLGIVFLWQPSNNKVILLTLVGYQSLIACSALRVS